MKAALAVLILCVFGAPAWAHKPSDAHLALAVDGDQLTGRLDIALRDLDGAIGLDANGDGSITWGEVSAASPRIAAYVGGRLALTGDGLPCPLSLGDGALVDLSDGAYWALPVTATCAHRPHALAIRYALLFDLDAQHRGLVHLSTDGSAQTLVIRNAEPVTATLGEGTSVGAFVKEGIWHIWGGIDHILFLLCLILPAVYQRKTARWQAADSLRHVCLEVFEIVTAFTLAHSITLVIASVGLVQLPSRFVETAIALSVAAAAANNLLRKIDARWAVAFSLGLLHGFGFSSVLVDLGLPSHELIGALLGFNVGVELGQAAIVIAFVPVLFAIRRTIAYQILLWGGSAAVVVIASIWSYQRCFG
ncbi:MAG TPA: HupE/UreJ family protein [Kofleriaceae bacterium]